MSRTVAVVGGGVVGLSVAHELSSSYKIKVIADKFGAQTDSVKATAIWHVYLVPETEEVLNLAKRTLMRLTHLHNTCREAMVEMVDGVELFRNSNPAAPSWADIPARFEFLSGTEVAEYNELKGRGLSPEDTTILESHPIKWGYKIRAPVVRMENYLSWLELACRDAGVEFISRHVASLNDLSGEADVIVNCTGLGSRDLACDRRFKSYKGQYFILRGGPDAPTEYIGDDDHPGGMAYMIPRGGEVLIGGCAEEGVEDLNLTLHLDDVIKRAGLYVPWLRNKRLDDQARPPVVGIRPARDDGIRLELVTNAAAVPVVHNYGHGGSGFSLSWGCAEWVSDTIQTLV